MPFATTHAVCLDGAVGHLIDVQTDVAAGSVGTTLVGRPDASLNEARDRCRVAILNSDLDWPATKRITILLAPSNLRKQGTHLDLAIAVSVLAASGTVPPEAAAGVLFVGELTLAGQLRPAAGVLPMVLAAAAQGLRRVFVPEPQAGEAAMVPGMEVFGVRSLSQVVAELCGEVVPDADPVVGESAANLLSWRGDERLEDLDLADISGMGDARYALEVAAAGGHHLLLQGPKGSGKTSLAERVPGILPDLSREESLELTAICSLAGTLDPAAGMRVRPAFAAPHHDASKASIVGGGAGHVRPGQLSLAHCGVLFLDEFPLFRADVIDALRQPLESGDITVARAEELVTLPARALVVLAANPCPCGEFTKSAGTKQQCDCSVQARRNYQAKVSGPVSDRIDITRWVRPVRSSDERDPMSIREDTLTVRTRVEAARRAQQRRYVDHDWRLNGHVPGPALQKWWPLQDAGRRRIEDEVLDGRLTRRGAVRVHRLAWTVQDLDHPGEDLDDVWDTARRPGVDEVDVALRLRSGQPLLVATVEGRPHRRRRAS